MMTIRKTTKFKDTNDLQQTKEMEKGQTADLRDRNL